MRITIDQPGRYSGGLSEAHGPIHVWCTMCGKPIGAELTEADCLEDAFSILIVHITAGHPETSQTIEQTAVEQCPCNISELPPHDTASHTAVAEMEWKATNI